ncbi:MAG: Vgb family protein [Ktedonobacteraceae bacterium]
MVFFSPHPSGHRSSLSLQASTGSPHITTTVVLGANGVLYFTQQLNDNGTVNPSVQASIGEITTSNGQVQISEVASLPNGGCLPDSIVEGSDGNLWFTEYYQIGTVTPGGQLTEYAIPNSDFLPDTITAGPDSNLWFTEYMGNRIGVITI